MVTGSGTSGAAVGGSTTGVAGAGGQATSGGGQAAPTGGGQAAVGAPAPGGSAVAAGDTSHCTEDGKQTDLISTAPDCKPTFVGDNGGATYPGVTGDSIKFIRWSCQSNEQVNAILQTQGLAATEQETDDMVHAVMDWMHATYEFYGRKLTYERIIGDCPSAPSDPAKSRQAAAEVVKKQPFIVCCTTDPAALDVFAQNGIIAIGGTGEANEFFAGRRPFRWDIFPQGTESVEWLAEYYCKKLAGGTADHAGQLIHPTIGGRTTPRRVALLGFDNGDGTTVPYVEHARDLLQQCSGGQDVPIIYYESDINRATEQTRAIVAKLIDEKVTTVVCLCDPIAPVFLTNGMTQNNYFPEHLLSGHGSGRLRRARASVRPGAVGARLRTEPARRPDRLLAVQRRQDLEGIGARRRAVCGLQPDHRLHDDDRGDGPLRRAQPQPADGRAGPGG